MAHFREGKYGRDWSDSRRRKSILGLRERERERERIRLLVVVVVVVVFVVVDDVSLHGAG